MLLIFQDKTTDLVYLGEFCGSRFIISYKRRTKWKALLYDGTTMSVWCDCEWYVPFM